MCNMLEGLGPCIASMICAPRKVSLTCRQTLDFSSRYCSILAPSMTPLLLKWMSMYFPKREELSLRIVLALPKAETEAKETSDDV